MEPKVVLYGAGKGGRKLYKFLRSYGCAENIYGFCDKAGREISSVEDKKVYLPEDLEGENIVYHVTIMDENIKNEVIDEIGRERCIDFIELADRLHIDIDRVRLYRELTAFTHIDDMDLYFESAESDESLDIFWGRESIFYKMFCKLDLTDTIELACGRGRHVSRYIENAGNIMLVDILQKNIDICKERFSGIEKIKFYKNDGYDLALLGSNAYSSLFSYDAMVHFELIDIYSYLQDIYRVLINGGRALLHHSNNSTDYKAAFRNAPHGRSFMSKECFAYLAHRAGFTVLDQVVIDWGGVPKLDGLTLIEKPLR